MTSILTPATNADRFDAFMARLRKTQVFNLDGHHADNADEMQNRHHSIVSALADYLEAEVLAFNWETGAQIEADCGSLLDAVFKDEIASTYQRERKILRAAEALKPSAYDASRSQREAA